MNGFIGHIVNRQLGAEVSVMPRLPGWFEPSANHTWNDGPSFFDSTHHSILQPDTSINTNDDLSESQNFEKKAPHVMAPEAPVQEAAYLHKGKYLKKDLTEQHAFDAHNSLADKNANGVKEKQVGQHALQNNALAAASYWGQAFSIPLSYEPEPAEKQANKEAVSSAVTNPNTFDADRGKPSLQQPPSSLNAIPVVFPVIRKPDTASRFSASLLQQQQQMPVIKVSIGRIEVRAVQSAHPAKPMRAETPKPRMSLEDYLNKRNGSRS